MIWHRFFRRNRADVELMEEIDSYMAEEIAENVARGVTERRRGGVRGSSSGMQASRLPVLLPSQWKCAILLLVAKMSEVVMPNVHEDQEGRATGDAGPDGAENA